MGYWVGGLLGRWDLGQVGSWVGGILGRWAIG